MNQELKQRLIEWLIAGDISAQEQIITDYTEAISYIADFLIRKGVTIRECGKWIPVTERLPIKGTNVLIYSKSGGRAEGELSEDGWWQYRWCCPQKDVTHWMPLPLPPGKENEDG